MDLNKSLFTEHLIRLNNLRFNKWIFEPGMLFLSEMKWWGDKGYRACRHNGLDLRLYETRNGTFEALCEDTKIPIIYEGRIVRSIKDSLGYTLFAAHEIYEGDSQLYTIYGHVVQTADFFIGKLLSEGTVVATLARTMNTKVPGHLHISIALIPRLIPLEALTWKTINESVGIRFLDPGLII